MARLALRFISGKYKDGEYLLPQVGEIFIGRSSEIDLVLMEDMVSRKHARIWFHNDEVNIEDLGSTNGTFINGEKIRRTTISKGDRVLIGTSIMKVVESTKSLSQASVPLPTSTSTGTGVGRNTVHGSSSMSGTIAEVPLPDLIQLFSSSKKTGTLVVVRDGIEGKIHLDKGQLVCAGIEGSQGLSSLKAIYRFLAWEDGTFELVGPEPYDPENAIDVPTEHILMDGLRQLDEFRHMQKKLPPLDSELVVVTPLMTQLALLSEEELNVFQLVYNYGSLQAVLDRSEIDDIELSNTIIKLIKENYIAKI